MEGARRTNIPHIQLYRSCMHHYSTARLHNRDNNTDYQAIEARSIELCLPAASSDDGERNTLWHEHFTQLLLQRRVRSRVSAHRNQPWNSHFHPELVGFRLSIYESRTPDAFHPQL